MLPRPCRGFPMKLTKRLSALLELLPPAARVADIGCDHGKLCLALLERGSRVWGVDISAHSLEKAALLVASSPYKDRFTAVEGDGFSALAGTELDAAVIAGLSGHTIGDMLRAYDGAPLYLALQPAKGCPALRETLDTLGFPVLEEICTEEAGHTYFSVLARGERTNRSPLWPDSEYSDALLHRGDRTYFQWLLSRRAGDTLTMENLVGQDSPTARLALERLQRKRAAEDGMLAFMEEKLEG